jgi:hypothetical protein
MSSSRRHHRDDVCLARHSRETRQDLQIAAEKNKGQMVSREQSSAAMHDDVIGWYARRSCDGVVPAIAAI